jgi:hypothetical protein
VLESPAAASQVALNLGVAQVAVPLSGSFGAGGMLACIHK